MRSRGVFVLLISLFAGLIHAQTYTLTFTSSESGAFEWTYYQGAAGWTAPAYCGRIPDAAYMPSSMGTACSAALRLGTAVRVTLRPLRTSTFYRWGGVCGAQAPSGVTVSGKKCEITLPGNAEVSAQWSQQNVTGVLVEGDIVLLRNLDGLYLAADPARERVYLSPNTAAWEQWQIGPLNELISYHGTKLMQSGGRWFHAPARSDKADGTYTLRTAKLNGTEWALSTENPLHNDSVIYRTLNISSILGSQGGSVGQPSAGAGGGGEGWYPDNGRWQILKVASPASGRRAKQAAVRVADDLKFKSSHNTYLYYSDLQRDPQNSNAYLPVYAAHRSDQYKHLEFQTTDYDVPMKFGDAVRPFIKFESPFGLYPDDATGSIRFKQYSDVSWTVADPTGMYESGNRVPMGAKVCLKSPSGKFMMADPASANLKLSPNCAGWESWLVSTD